MSATHNAGKAKPKNQYRSVQIGLRIEAWLKLRLQEIAYKDERTLAQVIRQACKEYVERTDRQLVAELSPE